MNRDSLNTVAITGARGRIGRLLVEELRGRGRRVVSLARSHGAVAANDDVDVDLTDAEAVYSVITRTQADVLVHLASVLRGDGLEEKNSMIDRAVAEAARSTRVEHVIHASSGAVYGTNNETACTEQSPLVGDTPYARSKREAEQIFADLCDSGEVNSALSLRIFNVAGPAFTDSLIYRLIHADPRRPVTLVQPDHFVRDYIYQDDLVSILCSLIDARIPGSSALNVGAGVPVSTRMLLTAFGTEPSALRLVSGAPSSNWADISKLRRLVDLTPRSIPDMSWG